MASPQKENGFTPIAHEILEAIQQFKFTLNELKIILCVLRYTYGFNRKSHSMSLSFFENHTGLSRSRINKAIKNLVNNNVLIITKKGDAKNPNTYMFNKDYDAWTMEKYSSFGSAEFDTSVQNDTTTSVQNDTTTSVRNGTQEINNKEIYITTTTTTIEPLDLYQQIIGRISPIQIDRLIDWEEEFNGQKEILNEAIRIADDRNRRSFGFVNYLLKEWFDHNLKNLEQIREYEKNKFKKRDWRKNSYSSLQPNIPPKKDIDFSEGEDWH